ncbi:MAG: response regulator transcription factor [Chloroflexi bacterium]|nr:response regulator transcription factor [Chloroflexota bacterium]
MKVLLVDDQALFLESLQGLLQAHGYQVAGVAMDGLDALTQARRLRPDLILMDIEMPRWDGLMATRLIKAEMPEVKIVMLTVAADDGHLFEAIKSGASGYLLKSLNAKEFLAFFAKMDQDSPPLAPGMAARLLNEFARQSRPAPASRQENESNLTARENEILTLVAQGLTYPQVGALLNLSERTVRYHMGEILARLHLQNRSQVIAYAARHGLIGS